MKLQLRWEMFNITNSVRFDSHSISATLDNPQNFGEATGAADQQAAGAIFRAHRILD
jgi:hypothetical protein